MLSIFTASALLQHCKANNKKKNLNPLNPSISMHILYTVLYTYKVIDEDNLLNNQEPFEWVVISHILLTFLFDSVVLIHREIRF